MRSTRALLAVALLIALGALALHAYRYHPFFSDDSLISLRYAERLLEGHGLTWNDGEYVEGYSNLLWVLGCALLGLLGLDLVFASRVLGLLGMGSAIAALVWHHAPRSLPHLLPALAGGLGMALTGCFAVWTVGGLEQPLVAGLLAWALVLTLPLLERDPLEPARPRETLWPGLLFGLLCWTRPDGPLFVACACGVLLFVGRLRGAAWRSALWLALPSLLFVLLQLVFRLSYYGDWVPNTAYSKLALTSHRLSKGVSYWWGGMLPLLGLALPAVCQLWVAGVTRALRVRTLLWLAPLLVWSAWVFSIGGDIFPGRRHLVVVVLLMALLSADFWRWAVDRLEGRARLVLWPAAAAALVLLASMQSNDRANLRALREIPWAQRGEALGRLLGEAFEDERPLLAATAAGALPYYSKLPALDMLGLNDRYLAQHPPANLGKGRIGHELGDGQYFLRRAPDLIVFCGTSGREKACARGGKEMQRDPRFERDYRLVTFLGTRPIEVLGRVWVRERSPRIGLRREQEGARIVLPAYLFSDARGSLATLDEEGAIGVWVKPGREARFNGLLLRPGRWRIHAEGLGEVAVSVLQHEGGERLGRGAGGLELELSGDTPLRIDLVLEGAAGDAHVRRLLLRRPEGHREPQPSGPLQPEAGADERQL